MAVQPEWQVYSPLQRESGRQLSATMIASNLARRVRRRRVQNSESHLNALHNVVAGKIPLIDSRFRHNRRMLSRFNEAGFVTFTPFLTAAATSAIAADISAIYTAACVQGKLDSEWIEQLHQSLPPERNWVWALASHPKVVAMMQQHLGSRDIVLCVDAFGWATAVM